MFSIPVIETGHKHWANASAKQYSCAGKWIPLGPHDAFPQHEDLLAAQIA
jgi:hypothetical protein